MFFFTPALALALALVVFRVFPARENFLRSSLGLLFIYTILRIGVYPVLISGWRSNRKYAMLGSLRAVAQTVSYEVSLALIFLFYLGLIKSLSLVELTWANLYFFKILVFIPLAGVWLISCLAETNRTPFDFAEGESELVSGFNVEFGAVRFALIFMAEYASIFFMSIFFVLVFFSVGTAPLIFYILTTGVIFFWVWARTTLPRYRYDLLISLAWKKYLPLTLFLLVYATALVI